MKGPTFRYLTPGKKVDNLSGLEKCALNINMALLTPTGTRPNLPEFGSKLHLLQFNPITDVLIDLTLLYIQECIEVSCPGVSLLDIKTVHNKAERRLNFQIVFRDNESGKQGTSTLEYRDGVYNG